MGAVLAFANQKGGVGKTTSVINIAAALGKRNRKVLLVDMDPQGNATSGVGIAKKKLKFTLYDAMAGKTDVHDAVVDSGFENLFVLPSNLALAGADAELKDESERSHTLARLLAPLRDEYHYILIDCPPSLNLLTINALTAASGVVIPMPCEYFAMEGLSQLMLSFKRVRELYNPTLEVTGILLTMYNGRLVLTQQVVAELRRYYDDKLFKTTISRNIKLCEAPGFGKPICYYDRWSRGAREYAEVAKELIFRI